MKQISHTNPDGSVVHVSLGSDVTIGNYVRLGDGVSLWNDVRLGDYASLGNDVRLGDGVSLGVGARLGDGVSLGNNVRLKNKVRLGDYASLGNDVSLGDYASLGVGAHLRDDDTTPHPISIARLGDPGWPVTMTAENLQVGCQIHPLTRWWGFSDRQIAAMDDEALGWWRTYKPALAALAAAKGWPTPEAGE